MVTIQHYDGTTSVDIEKITLGPGEQFVMSEDGEWRHLTAWGGEYEPLGAGNYMGLGIAGTLAETLPRHLVIETNIAPLTSGTLWLQLIYLPAGTLVSNISFFSATTAAGTPTNQFFALYSRRFGLLARSADDTTTAWAANTIKTLAMTTPYRVPVSDFYYVGIMVAATTVPTLKGFTSSSNLLSNLILQMRGPSTASLTTALPDPASSPSVSTSSVWAAIT